MIKKTILSFLLIASGVVNGQTFKCTVTSKADPSKELKSVSETKLDSDNYETNIFLVGSQDSINAIGTYSIKAKLVLNGIEIPNNYWFRFEKSSDTQSSEVFFAKPSLKTELDLTDIMKDNGHALIEKGNTLKINFVHSKENNRFLGTAEIKFDVPGYNTFDSDLCNLLNAKSDDPKVDNTIKSLYDLMYPKAEFLTVLMGDWYESKDSDEVTVSRGNTFMLLFRYKGKVWSLKYSVSYVSEDGVLQTMPRVKVYNGFDEPFQVAESCWKSLQAVIN